METINYNMINWVKSEDRYPSVLINGLLENKNFTNYFINTFADLSNTVFKPELVVARIDSYATIIRDEMPAQIEKWGTISSFDTWLNNINDLIYFANNRLPIMQQHFISEFQLASTASFNIDINNKDARNIQINSIKLDSFPWNGNYFQGVPINLEAIPKSGYVFAGWTGDIETSERVITYTPIEKNNLVAFFQAIEEPKELPKIVINEINYNGLSTNDPNDWVELYNNSDESIDLSNWVLKDNDDTHIFSIPEMTSISSGDYLVLCNDLVAFSTIFPNVQNLIGNLGFGFSGGGELLRLYQPSQTLVDTVEYDDVAPWPTEPDGNGPTLELKHPDLDNSVGTSWISSDSNGTPGAINSFSQNGIFLNISTDTLIASTDTSTMQITIESNNFWKIQNNNNWLFMNPDSGFGNTNLNIYSLENNDSLKRFGKIIFESGNIKKELVVIQDGLEVFNIFVSIDSSKGGYVLGSGKYLQGTTVRLIANPNTGWKFLNWSENDSIISYDSTYTFQAQFNRNIIACFQEITTSIKSIKTVPTSFVLSQNYPNPFNPYTIIRYSIPDTEKLLEFSVQLKVFDVLGNLVLILVNKHQIPGNYKVNFNAMNLSSGIYYYQLTADEFIETKKMLLIK